MANTNKNRPEGTAPSVVDKARDMASDVKDKVQDTATSFTERAGEAASTVAHRAGEMASTVGKKVDRGVSAAGTGMQSFAETVRDRGPSSGVLGSATSAVADTLEDTGEYLESHGLSGIASDLTDLIRRNPIPALLIGIGVGFLIARATRS
ncbi:MAG: hypothetical protein HYS12_09120 [Planctomycetes bacterium]|nr:hypothetical protein [Planctomycetota bacterium]